MGFLLKNCKQNIRFIFGIALFALSFFYAFQHVINVFHLPIIGGSATVSYYDPFGRMWEVLAGGMIGVLPRKDLRARPKIVQALIILLSTSLVIMSFVCNTDEFLVILTVLLTGMIIGMEKNAFLENKILCYIGKISYPLYLIHFPLIVACVRWNFARPSLLVSILLIILIFVLALFLNVHVENKNFSIRSIFFSVIFGLVCLCSFHKFGWSKFFICGLQHIEGYKSQLQDVDERFNSGYDEVLLRGNGGTQSQLFAAYSAETKNMLMLGNAENEPEFLLIGDSNAQHLFSGIDIICKSNHISGIHLTTTIMPFPGLSYYHDATYYWNFNKYEAFLSWLIRHPSLHTVFISQAWYIRMGYFKESKNDAKHGNFAQELRRFCNDLKRMGKNVVLINPGPCYLKYELLTKCDSYVSMRNRREKPIDLSISDDPAVISHDEYLSRNTEVLSLFEELEKQQICRVLHIENGIFREGNFSLYMHDCLYMHDGIHLTPRGSIYIMDGVKEEFLEYIDSGRKEAKEKVIHME